MLDSILAALSAIFSWPNFLFILAGVLVGLTFGALPGLGGTIAVALLIPLTFFLDPSQAMMLIVGSLGGVAFGGSVTAILLNVPGIPPNAATCFDGYPMTQQGKGAEALGISATSSALGALIGVFFLVLLIPVAREIVLAFWTVDRFWLAIFGLTIIAVITQGNFLKGIISACVGLLLSFVGFSIVTGDVRYGFGIDYLWDGIQIIPLVIGMFAIGEVLHLSTQRGTISRKATDFTTRDTLRGVKITLQNWRLVLQSSVIGTLVGMMPGAGGTIANFFSYGQAVQWSDDPESFGQGNPRGVIASEAANDAKDGGAMLPTVAFAIPGSATWAIILSGLVIHGIDPGPDLLGERMDILWVLIFTLVISNLISSAIGITSSKYLARVTNISVTNLIPVILFVSLTGSYLIRLQFLDVIQAVLLGFLAFLMILYNYSRVALILGFILGPLIETSFHTALRASGYNYGIFISRPISIVLILATLLSLLLPIIQQKRGKTND